MKHGAIAPLALLLLCLAPMARAGEEAASPRLHPALRNPRLLTQNPGSFRPWDNAECYFDLAGERLVLQATRDGGSCDQIYTMDLQGQGLRRVSDGTGRTTCAFFSPDGGWIVYASTKAADPRCPPPPDMSQGYTWSLYAGYDLYKVPTAGGKTLRLTDRPGYDAEAVFRPDGRRILFTSTRDGDLELYDMDPQGGDIRRLTHTPGYDGGAFYTADGRHIVFRARHPEGEELSEYRRLLGQDLVRPSQLDLYVMDADGGNPRRLTFEGDQGATNWAPYPHPDGRWVIYASNRDDYDGTVPGRYGFNFELYLLPMEGGTPTRLTWNETFDGFPMFSPDGRKLVWCGNYVPARPRDTDVLMADWAGVGP